MKKILLIILFLGMGYLLITRFVSYRVPQTATTRPHIDCISKGTPRFDEDVFEIIQTGISCEQLSLINANYLIEIKPIFQSKCLMCHGQPERLPLYAKFPPSSFLVLHDQEEAKKHMNMTYDFPFGGHGSPKDDLAAIAKVVKKGKMPPLRYKILHWKSGLTEMESEKILSWVNRSMEIINQ